MRLLPDEFGDRPRSSGGLLYRVEQPSQGPPIILAQTRIEPRTEFLADWYESETADLAGMLSALSEGMTVRYRSVASPIKRSNQTGRESALVGDEVADWWLTRLRAAGLSSLSDPLVASQPVAVKEWRRIPMTRFDGAAKIVDVEALTSTLAAGIGRNKSWGCGLLTLAPG